MNDGAFEEEPDASTGGRFQKWYGNGADKDAARASSNEAAFAASRTDAYWARLGSDLEKIRNGGTTTAEKMRILKSLSEEQNLVSKGGAVGLKINGDPGTETARSVPSPPSPVWEAER